jgi:hypothetical protein
VNDAARAWLIERSITAHRQEWCDWFTSLGINPNHVADLSPRVRGSRLSWRQARRDENDQIVWGETRAKNTHHARKLTASERARMPPTGASS